MVNPKCSGQGKEIRKGCWAPWYGVIISIYHAARGFIEIIKGLCPEKVLRSFAEFCRVSFFDF